MKYCYPSLSLVCQLLLKFYGVLYTPTPIVWVYSKTVIAMRGSRNFRQGGPGQSDNKALTTSFFGVFLGVFFLFFFLVLSLFYRSQRNLSFFKVPEGSNIFQGGPTFSRGESNCLFPIETYITCDFPGGGGSGPPVPPSGSALDS